MLAKQYKIQKKKEVDLVFKQGRSSFDAVVGVKCVPSEQKHSRFVIIVSKKVSKKASARNAVKRRLSEICRLALPQLISHNNFFILALPQASQKTYQELERSILNHFKKLGAL